MEKKEWNPSQNIARRPEHVARHKLKCDVLRGAGEGPFHRRRRRDGHDGDGGRRYRPELPHRAAISSSSFLRTTELHFHLRLRQLFGRASESELSLQVHVTVHSTNLNRQICDTFCSVCFSTDQVFHFSCECGGAAFEKRRGGDDQILACK